MTRLYWLTLAFLFGGVALLFVAHKRAAKARQVNTSRAKNALTAALGVKGRSSADACVRYALNRLT